MILRVHQFWEDLFLLRDFDTSKFHIIPKFHSNIDTITYYASYSTLGNVVLPSVTADNTIFNLEKRIP